MRLYWLIFLYSCTMENSFFKEEIDSCYKVCTNNDGVFFIESSSIKGDRCLCKNGASFSLKCTSVVEGRNCSFNIGEVK